MLKRDTNIVRNKTAVFRIHYSTVYTLHRLDYKYLNNKKNILCTGRNFHTVNKKILNLNLCATH